MGHLPTASRAIVFALTLAACQGKDDDSSAANAQLYRNVATLLQPSCAQLQCHGRDVAGAHLDFMVDDFRTELVGVPACEDPAMQRVNRFDPDNSYLMVKIAAAVEDGGYLPFIEFEPPLPVGDRAIECEGGMLDDGHIWFGVRMPADDVALTSDKVALFRDWIAAGAPGPDGK